MDTPNREDMTTMELLNWIAVIVGIVGLGIVAAIFLSLSEPANNVRFSDIPEGHPNARAIQSVAGNGYFVGDGQGNFMPDKELTRCEVAVLLVRLNEGPEFEPLEIVEGDWCYNWMMAALDRQLVNPGDPNEWLGPATRADVAQLLDMALRK